MSECKIFLCMYIKGDNCTLINEKCTKNACKTMYAKCSSCMENTCIFHRNEGKVVDSRAVDKQVEETPEIVARADDDLKYPYAYIDGSFYNGTYGFGGYVVDENKKVHTLQGSGKKENWVQMRNVAGEICGALAAIKYAKEHGYDHLTIYYDYLGIENWATGKWKANKPETQFYQKYCRESKIRLNFIKVKGHSGIAGNDEADRLAKQAVGAGR